MGVILKTKKEIEALRKANSIVVEVLNDLKAAAAPGMTTMDLEKRAAKIMKKTGAKSAFLGYRGFPGILCASVNEEIVHGIPSDKKVLKDGDIVSIDFGVELEGYYGDAALTFPVGKVSEEKEKLMRTTREALHKAIEKMIPGNHLSDLADAVQCHAESNGFSVVYQFVGHGIGRQMHEDPQVPNCGKPSPDVRLAEGMVLAVEPMINVGVAEVDVLDDGWTAVTADRKPSAHFERSVAVTADGPDILSDW
ncbi:MAG: type I methionyl aminopeptidase [bacterium]